MEQAEKKKGGNLWKYCLFFTAGLACGYLLWNGNDLNTLSRGEETRLAGSYKFTNPLLSCEVAGDKVEFPELKNFKYKIENILSSETKDGNIQQAAIYFRDLNNGMWIGINEKEDYAPGSLLKVPLMMLYYHKIDHDPALAAKELTYTGEKDENSVEYYKPSSVMDAGKSYSVDELVRRMIVYSDNNAMGLLISNVSQDEFVEAYTDLGIIIPGVKEIGDLVSVKNYAAVFRMLYNASYLSREMSEKALKLLSEVEFKEALAAGLPQNVAISHKFGEKMSGENGSVKQIHDCGIVYLPIKPYLLCVMTKGQDPAVLSRTIARVSKIVYEDIDSQVKR
jgi:beta-lactamase class A